MRSAKARKLKVSKRLNRLISSVALSIGIALPFIANDGFAAESVPMTATQKAELSRVVPGLNITPELAAKLRATAYDQSLTINQRIEAIRELAGYPKGEAIRRKICIWDIVGRSGPVFTAAQDQRLRL